jgi:5-methylcytosine-specific restriction endonuclease McrA
MSFSVTDDAVREFADRLRNGTSTGNLFPGKMSDCDFTPAQREIIKSARLARRAHLKSLKASEAHPSTEVKKHDKQPQQNKTKAPGLTKLEKMLYLQGGKCYFCGQVLLAAEASIDHLLPLSHGGQRVESNEVVCHKTVNEAFGSMDLKRKMDFILRSEGRFQCPKTSKPK